jgi:hypothetical protein
VVGISGRKDGEDVKVTSSAKAKGAVRATESSMRRGDEQDGFNECFWLECRASSCHELLDVENSIMSNI